QTSARTHFEIKYLERGELCQQLIMTKPEGYKTRFDDFVPLQGQVYGE
ncbi:SAM-dependent methyltransferase, partial [Acinetobacter sp. 228]